ncbi:Hypothetical Protein FCC1311_053882 [Hondaea fermentalgiana]|uniref:PH domain-containing protein n=1 Tax=Hondaea fermentalgiana TaxID=2315210 RepID=A0A2R5GE02_9STRA|nr:Hypothetical Protein FCC1311_053882 [Hondaea fermentalgiana]|eukprot:GBG29166.1 Hypothetical Protein FCC1311_053882 [Hondaea fermentalgiana]
MDADIDDVYAKTSAALKKEDEAIDNALHTSIRNELVASQQHADGLEDLAAKSLGLSVETSSTHSNVSQKSATQHHTREVDRAALKRASSSDNPPERETDTTNAYPVDILKTPHDDGGKDATPVSNRASTSDDGRKEGGASSISSRANNLGEDKEMPESHSEMGQTPASASEPQSPWSPWTAKSPTDTIGDVSIPPIELAALGKNGASMSNIPEEFEFTSPADASSSGKDLMVPLTGVIERKITTLFPTFERLWSFFHKWVSWINPSGNQVQPGPAILQSSDNGPSTLANPRPEVSAAELDVSEDNRANAWECYWSILINGKLYLYESYGDLKPLYVIRAAQCKTFSAAFSGTFDSPEFAIEATNATAQGMVIEPVGKRRRLHNHLRGASRVWFVTTSRAQTVTWVSKLRAAAHAQNPSPRIEDGNDETV